MEALTQGWTQLGPFFPKIRQISIGAVGWKKNSKINKRGDVYFPLKNKHYVYKLIFKYFVDSIFSEKQYKNFDFKLNANKRGEAYQFT